MLSVLTGCVFCCCVTKSVDEFYDGNVDVRNCIKEFVTICQCNVMCGWCSVTTDLAHQPDVAQAASVLPHVMCDDTTNDRKTLRITNFHVLHHNLRILTNIASAQLLLRWPCSVAQLEFSLSSGLYFF